MGTSQKKKILLALGLEAFKEEGIKLIAQAVMLQLICEKLGTSVEQEGFNILATALDEYVASRNIDIKPEELTKRLQVLIPLVQGSSNRPQ